MQAAHRSRKPGFLRAARCPCACAPGWVSSRVTNEPPRAFEDTWRPHGLRSRPPSMRPPCAPAGGLLYTSPACTLRCLTPPPVWNTRTCQPATDIPGIPNKKAPLAAWKQGPWGRPHGLAPRDAHPPPREQEHGGSLPHHPGWMHLPACTEPLRSPGACTADRGSHAASEVTPIPRSVQMLCKLHALGCICSGELQEGTASHAPASRHPRRP